MARLLSWSREIEAASPLLTVEYLLKLDMPPISNFSFFSFFFFFFSSRLTRSFVHHRKYWISITKYCGRYRIFEMQGSIRFDRPRQPARFRGKLLRRFCPASSIINTAVTARNWRGNNGEAREPYHRPDIFGCSSAILMPRTRVFLSADASFQRFCWFCSLPRYIKILLLNIKIRHPNVQLVSFYLLLIMFRFDSVYCTKSLRSIYKSKLLNIRLLFTNHWSLKS